MRKKKKQRIIAEHSQSKRLTVNPNGYPEHAQETTLQQHTVPKLILVLNNRGKTMSGLSLSKQG
jgi:hypothetical protein